MEPLRRILKLPGMTERRATKLYNNDSILQVGNRYRGCKFDQVPAWYFLWLLKEGVSDLGLKEWLELNEETLKAEKAAERQAQPIDREAMYERQRIIRKRFGGKKMTTRPGDYIPPTP